jgi:hypothetical protein
LLLLLEMLLLGLVLLLLLFVWRAAAAAARVVVLLARLPKPLPLLGNRLEAGGGGGLAAAAAAGFARFSLAPFVLLLLLLLLSFLLLLVRLLLLSGLRLVLLLLSGLRLVLLLLLLLSCLLRLVLLPGPLRLPAAADSASFSKLVLEFAVPAALFVLASDGRDFLSALSEPAAAARFAEAWLLPAPAPLLLPAAFLGFAEGAATRLRYCCITSVRLGVLLGCGCCLAAAATCNIWRTAEHRLLVRTTCRAPLHRSEGCSRLRMASSNSRDRPFEGSFPCTD